MTIAQDDWWASWHGLRGGNRSQSRRLLRDICNERLTQIEVFGVQSMPGAPQEPQQLQAACFALRSEAIAKAQVVWAFEASRLTWTELLVEELAEAIHAPSERERRKELVQLAALCCQWIEDIDRKME